MKNIQTLPPLEIGELSLEGNPISKWVLYGASGSGKTYMAGTFPKPLFLDLENGMASLRPLVESGKKILRIPSKGPIVSFSDFLDCLALVEKTLIDSPDLFQTVVVDSVNQLQYFMTQEILLNFDKTRDYEDQLTRADYGKLARLLENTVVRLFSLPVDNVVLLIGTQQQGPDEVIWPALIGTKSIPMILRLADAVGYCFSDYTEVTPNSIGRPQFFVSFVSSGKWIAKSRGIEFPLLLPNKYPAEYLLSLGSNQSV
jgi:hypothetical protein